MTEINRRRAIKAAAWAAPVVAIAAAAPLATASGATVTITGFSPHQFGGGLYALSFACTGIPEGGFTRATLSMSPDGPGIIGVPSPPVSVGDSTGEFTVYGFTPGQQYTFTVTLSGMATAQDSYVHTFS